MGFFESIHRFRRDFKAGVDEERVKLEIEAFRESKSTDEYVTMTIMGDGELEIMTRSGWDLVTKVTASEYTFMNQYLVRKRRGDLAGSLDLEA